MKLLYRMVNVFQFQTFPLSDSWLLKSAEIYWTPTTNIGDFSIKKYLEFSKFKMNTLD